MLDHGTALPGAPDYVESVPDHDSQRRGEPRAAAALKRTDTGRRGDGAADPGQLRGRRAVPRRDGEVLLRDAVQPRPRPPATCSRSTWRSSAAGCCARWCTSCRWSTGPTTWSRSCASSGATTASSAWSPRTTRPSAWRCSPRSRTTPARRGRPQVEQAWAEAFTIVARAMQEAAAADDGPAFWPATVVDAPAARAGTSPWCGVEPDHPVPYQPGQYVSVETPQRPRLWRYLPAGERAARGRRPWSSTCARSTAAGSARAIVAHTQPGDQWRIGPPIGRLTRRPRVPRRTC